jgi:hypothetical protein
MILLFSTIATLVLLYPSQISTTGKSSSTFSSSVSTSSSLETVSSSSTTTSISSSSSQSSSYSSYIPPSSDTILLKDPCNWACNSNSYDQLVLNYSAFFGVPDPMAIKAQIAQGTNFNPNATLTLATPVCGEQVDYGLMEINPNCYSNLNPSLLFNASYNLYWGIKFWADDYLSLRQEWGSSCNTSMVIAGVIELYDGGPQYVGTSCGSFPNGLNYIGLVSRYYFPFCQNASYTPILQKLNYT